MPTALKLLCIIGCFTVLSCKPHNDVSSDQDIIDRSCVQVRESLSSIDANKENNTIVFPRTESEDGVLHLVGKRDWTSGFYPGILWLADELSDTDEFKASAVHYTELLEEEKFNSSNHDLGFKMMPSYGLAYAATGNKAYRDVLVQSARTLITRFNENVGCIRSWDHHKDKWDYPVIIDNLMNLELLMFAWHETNEPSFYNIAVAHARTTMKNHFREDYSSYHVVSYDPTTGEVMARNTHQGFADESSWARGQAWALYGYTMLYRETQLPEFLAQAEHVAHYIIHDAQLPSDHIPFWDFDDTDIPNVPKDASAAAVMASALYELSTFSDAHSVEYVGVADDMMHSLYSDAYFNEAGTHNGFLLSHSTGSLPRDSEIDVPLVYADYYFLEALKRKISLNK